MYSEDDLLLLSGLQHMAFCERQWALIHIEQIWEENRLTAQGRVLHDRVHGQTEEVRHDLLIARGLPVHSFRLGLSGQADVVEFARVSTEQHTDTIQMEGRTGWWRPAPVEYKRGRVKREGCDRIQVCAQALCLEEMYGIGISEGALFYGTNRRRNVVPLGPELRERTEALAVRMHDLFDRRVTPRAVVIPGCKSCSLRERCFPDSMAKRRSMAAYYRSCLAEK
ncbi:MAG: CRISPR-associated protein Cas4 [Bryobacteraceae bacterium]